MQSLAESTLGVCVDWTDSTTGFLPCPGAALHTKPSGKRDCRVRLDGAPTVFCVHQSCTAAIAEVNRNLRSALGKAEYHGASSVEPPRCLRLSADEQKAIAERKARHDESERRRQAAKEQRERILADYAIAQAELFHASPVALSGDPVADWPLILRLFAPTDTLWIGERNTSGHPQFAAHFRPAGRWAELPHAPAQLICPNPFKPGVFSRSNDNVAHLRFLVVESDTLTKSEICAVFNWLHDTHRLRAVVDTGGKSLHGWFDHPSEIALNRLKDSLPVLGCDPTMFKPSQPCRLPGAVRRDGKPHFEGFSLPEGMSHEPTRQNLLYLDLER